MLLLKQRLIASYGDEEFDPRVSALTPASQTFLEQLGIWQSMSGQRVSPYEKMHVWDAEGTGSIDFNCQDIQQPVLGHIVENHITCNELLSQIQNSSQITFICPAKLTSLRLPQTSLDQAELELEDGQIIRSQLIIAADGANSKVRSLAQFETREWPYEQKAIVTTVKTEQPHQHTAWQRFLIEGPLAFLPLQEETNIKDNAYYSSIVWSADTQYADNLMALDDHEFSEKLGTAFEHKLGKIESISKRYCFPLVQRHAKDYVRHPIVLIGDAAHSIHPLAGQGVNLGLSDAKVLAEEIGRACEKQIPLTDTASLQRYQRRRMPDNLAMMATMEGFKRLFGQSQLPIQLVT